jgi:hypothetical protein
MYVDFNISTRSWTDAAKSGGEFSLNSISLQGSASIEMCGCLFPPCHRAVSYNFTCGFMDNHAIPSYFHGPYPFRNSEVTNGALLDPETQIESITGQTWRYLGIGVLPSSPILVQQNFSAPDTGYHAPLPIGNSSIKAAAVTCNLKNTNVTCTSGDYEVTCFIPTPLSTCSSSHPMYSTPFPPCSSNTSKTWCGSVASMASVRN